MLSSRESRGVSSSLQGCIEKSVRTHLFLFLIRSPESYEYPSGSGPVIDRPFTHSVTRSHMYQGSTGRIDYPEKGEGLADRHDLHAGFGRTVDSPTRDRGVYGARIGQRRAINEGNKFLRFVVM